MSRLRGKVVEMLGSEEPPEVSPAAAPLIKIDRSLFANPLAGACTLISTLPPSRRLSS